MLVLLRCLEIMYSKSPNRWKETKYKVCRVVERKWTNETQSSDVWRINLSLDTRPIILLKILSATFLPQNKYFSWFSFCTFNHKTHWIETYRHHLICHNSKPSMTKLPGTEVQTHSRRQTGPVFHWHKSPANPLGCQPPQPAISTKQAFPWQPINQPPATTPADVYSVD